MAKTGGHFERCNVGSVEAHNERTQAYLEGVKAAGLPLYFFQELTANNTHWVNDRQEFAGKTCSEIFEDLKQLYTAKTGQAPQLKDRVRINKKTGKEYTVAGWSPIREAVIPIKPDTSTEDFKPVFDWLRANGLEPIRLDLHKDEGYKDEETGEVKMNYHAHLVVCWVDLQTGKTANLKKDKMSEFNQTVLPSALGMEAGTSKAITGAEHLAPAAQRAKAEAERQAAKVMAAAEEKVQHLEERQQELQRQNSQLQVTNTAKKAAVAIGEATAGLFKQSSKDKQIKALTASIPVEVANAKADERKAVLDEIKQASGGLRVRGKDGEDITSPKTIGERWRANLDRKRELEEDIEELKTTHSEEMAELRESHKQQLQKKDTDIELLRKRMKRLSDWVFTFWPSARKAVAAITDMLTNAGKPHFNERDVTDIEAAMKSAKNIDERKAYGKDLVEISVALSEEGAPYLKSTSEQVEEIADGTFKGKHLERQSHQEEEQQQNRPRGRHM